MRRETKRRGIRAISVTALFASLAAATPGIALAAPSDEEIARAREAENAAKMSVAQIEVELASVKSEAEVALQKAMSAAEELNGARYSLEQATQTARQAQADADKAKADYEAGKREIASIAQTAYRDGGSSLDSIAPYLSADGLRTVETKQATLNSFSASANVKMQKVAALEQVANVMNDAAIQAQAKQAEATAQVETRSAAAQSAANNASNAQAMTAARRDALVAELARKQNTTVELINQREAELEAQRQAAAAEAARQAAAAEAARQQAAAEAARRAREQQNSYTPAPAPAASYDDDDDTPSWGGGGGGNSDAAAGAIAWAKSKLGAQYVWAGEGPGYDCSGLVTMAYRSQGIYLTHWSQAQYSEGTRVPVSQAQPGDLIFWNWDGGNIDHVAIYLGNNQIIEAPTFGVPVRITSIYGWSAVLPYAVRVV
ncbi:C40 family peptidase [Actinomyces sp. oral taxon 181]|uniref:C40 family peptidase n=1 Tax=Actinomyces sp. oral taxon 181 TaxID=712121 RepID=UPI0002A2247B|nr:C40 family peptidase [Actinomyces sp. oral taxon 181]EKY15934.1 NlpC/P60 family protein [Actinomyces sp. oral taxon 181 str. F0379]